MRRHSGFGWLGLLGTLLLGWTVAAGAAEPIRIGEINSYSGIAAGFTLAYRQAVEMAVNEINTAG